jgi:hypothetical protein
MRPNAAGAHNFFPDNFLRQKLAAMHLRLAAWNEAIMAGVIPGQCHRSG